MQLPEEEMQEIIVTESNLIHSLLETALTEIAPRGYTNNKVCAAKKSGYAEWSSWCRGPEDLIIYSSGFLTCCSLVLWSACSLQKEFAMQRLHPKARKGSLTEDIGYISTLQISAKMPM